MFGRLCPHHVVSCRTETMLLNTCMEDDAVLKFNEPHHFQETLLEQEGAPVDCCSSPPLPSDVHLKRLESTSKGCFPGGVRWPHWHGSEGLLICSILVTYASGVTAVIIVQGLPSPTFLFHSCPSAVCSPIIPSYFVSSELKICCFFFYPVKCTELSNLRRGKRFFVFLASSQR